MDFDDRLPMPGLVEERAREAIAAIGDEITASVAANRDSMRISGGQFLHRIGTTALWSFDVTLAPDMPADTRGTLHLDINQDGDSSPEKSIIRVDLVAMGDNTVVIATESLLLSSTSQAPSGVIEFSAAWVLDALRKRIDGSMAADANSEMVESLLIPDLGEYPADDGEGAPDTFDLDVDAKLTQEKAALAAVEPGVRFTWGPPGTGKTTVLARAVLHALNAGLRVLVLAHANVAVDVAMIRVAELLASETDEIAKGRVLRVGTPRLAAMYEHPAVLPTEIALDRHPDIGSRLSEIASSLTELSDRARKADGVEQRRQIGKEVNALSAENERLATKLRSHQRDVIDDALVIGTTLSKAVVDDQLWEWPADVVIVDEASMAGLPHVLAFALRNPLTLSFFGDFRQLPPVAISTTQRAQEWFARDVFELAGVREAYELGEPDTRLSVLRVQFRMGESICETVNQLAYDGMLRTHPIARDRAIRLAEISPMEGAEVVIVDTSRLGTACEIEQTPSSYSRLNPFSAALSLTVATRLAQQIDGDVAVLSPYRAQAQVLAALSPGAERLDVATIHRFQGGERDAVVVDVTDAAPTDKASTLTGTDAELSMRLLNVAASRARAKLVIVADLDFIDRVHPLGSKTRALLEAADAAACETIDALDLLDDLLNRSAGSMSTGVGSPGPPVGWHRSFDSALAVAESYWVAGTGRGWGNVEFNLPIDDFGTDRVEAIVESMLANGVIPVVRGTPRGISRISELESDGRVAEIRLILAGVTRWAAMGDWLVIGSTEAGRPAALCNTSAAAPLFTRLFGVER